MAPNSLPPRASRALNSVLGRLEDPCYGHSASASDRGFIGHVQFCDRGAAASAGVYFVRGDIAAPITGPVALGSMVGAALGARILMRVPNERLRVLFVVVLVDLAAQMPLSASGIKLVEGGG